MNDVAPAPDQAAPTVVAGVAPVARVIAAALLRAGRSVVGLVDALDDPGPDPARRSAAAITRATGATPATTVGAA